MEEIKIIKQGKLMPKIYIDDKEMAEVKSFSIDINIDRASIVAMELYL